MDPGANDSGGPTADELTDAQVAAVQAASDEARTRWAEIVARDPSVKAAMTGKYGDERAECLHRVRDAYAAVGVSPWRAQQAAEAWLIARRGVRGDLRFADELIEDFRRRRGDGED